MKGPTARTSRPFQQWPNSRWHGAATSTNQQWNPQSRRTSGSNGRGPNVWGQLCPALPVVLRALRGRRQPACLRLLRRQSKHPLSSRAKVASAGMWELCAQEDGPMSREYAVHTDEQGFDNGHHRLLGRRGRLWALVSKAQECIDWRWTGTCRSRPLDRSVQSGSTWLRDPVLVQHLPGRGCKGCHGRIQRGNPEHGYWGSMRDRLPIAQTEATEPAGRPYAAENSGIVRVEPHDNWQLSVPAKTGASVKMQNVPPISATWNPN